ncbi:MAG: DEAD/DEAH box helicase family protein, partial [Pseudomonadota bacterium]
QVIIDECHHISAFSFERVIKKAKARFVLGLTATPTRKDGHHPIIMMQCGPIRFRTSTRAQALERPFEHVVIPRFTDFSLPVELQVTATTSTTAIQDIYAALVLNGQRNMMIFNDLMMVLEQGRSPLLITERTEHLEYFAGMLKGFAKNIITLKGGMGVKKRREVAERIASIPDSEERLLLGTGRYIGEGFDDARLDTLLLALPISWRGTLKQYTGRLHRLHESKKVVRIYDYVDADVPVLMKMYARRLKGYRAIGYTLSGDEEFALNKERKNP